MKTFGLSSKILKREYKSGIVYGAALTVCIISNLLFINILDDVYLVAGDKPRGGPAWADVYVPLSMAIPFLVICVSWVMILYVTDYYFKNKESEFAMLKIAGGSMVDAMKYVLHQLCFIVTASIAAGYTIGILLMQIIFPLFYEYLNIEAIYIINMSDQIETLTSIFTLIFVILVALMGYCHRNTIKVLLGREEGTSICVNKAGRRKYDYLFMYIISFAAIPTMNHEMGGYIIFSCFAVISMNGLIKQTIPYFVSKWKKEIGVASKYLRIALSNYVNSMQNTLVLFMLMLTMVSGLLPFILSLPVESNEYVTSVLSYLVIVILLSISVSCKFVLSITARKKEFINLSSIGFVKKELGKIITLEVIIYYLSIVLLPLPHILIISYRYYIMSNVAIGNLYILFSIFLFPIIVSAVIVNFVYKKIL